MIRQNLHREHPYTDDSGVGPNQYPPATDAGSRRTRARRDRAGRALPPDFPGGVFALACNLGILRRQSAAPRSVKHWLLTTLRKKQIRIDANVVRQARYGTCQMAEVVVPRRLIAAILYRFRLFGARRRL